MSSLLWLYDTWLYQDIDSRLINEHNIKRLAEIPINPLRIAFDHWELRDIYEKAVRLAAEAGIKSLSRTC